MPLLDLAPEERAELMRLLRQVIDADPVPLSLRIRTLRSIHDKLDPPASKPQAYPAPKPAGAPSLVYAKLRGGRRKR